MTVSRRTLVTAAAIAGSAARAAAPADIAGVAADLARRSQIGNDALMRGDVERYRSLVPLASDFTLMSPFGGKPSRGADITPERWAAMRTFFQDGSLEQEVVAAYTTADMVVLAVVERALVAVGGLPKQPWGLRVTLVYRREAGEWRLAHRHADPLAPGISVGEAAALARGAHG